MDPAPYPSDTSDIVALMVLEHQVTVQNQIGYINFKAPAVLHRRDMAEAVSAKSWDGLPALAQDALIRMMDKLVSLMVFMEAADFSSPISGLPAYTEGFMAKGPVDEQGRSLREFDLRTRLFRYPLSYLVHTEEFKALPPYALDYLYSKLAAYLSGEIELEGSSQYSRADRQDALDILIATDPDFRNHLAARESDIMHTAGLHGWD
jgi:hypothetical protein